MGLTRSTPTRGRYTQPSEREIVTSLENMFKTNRSNMMSAASDTINFNNNDNQLPMPTSGGYNNYRRPAKYNKYYIDFDKAIKNGGNVSDVPSTASMANNQDRQVSEFSEFEKIQQHLLKMGGPTQLGGIQENDIDDTMSKLFDLTASITTEPSARNKNLKNFLNVLHSGHLRGGNGDRDSSSSSKSGSSSSSSSSSKAEAEEDQQKAADDIEESEDEESDQEEEDEEKDEGYNKFSETSGNTANDINILPFYSTSSDSDYSFRHPYIKNRFN